MTNATDERTPASAGVLLACESRSCAKEFGLFRGAICDACNHMLGKAYDDPNILVSGAKYLWAMDGTV